MHKPDASVLGDFVLAFAGGEPERVFADGAVQEGGEGRARFIAIADLIGGKLDEGVGALGGDPPQRSWRGRFVYVAWNAAERRVVALTDHLSTLSLYALVRDDVLVVGTDLRKVAATAWCRRELDLKSIYHYLNFACIPAPGTIFRDIRRLEPGTRLTWQAGRASEQRYWLPEYAEDLSGSDASLAGELRERMVATVKAYGPTGERAWGCFLSGGTDSSSIVSILSQERGRGKVKSFSIGFDEEGYDEAGFARLAAEACGANPTFGKVSRAQAQALVSRVVESYDQPFGNASAIPTIACGDLAHAGGMTLLLAGDGGDEIFGGNQRYAKDKVMEAWFAMPAPLKAAGRLVGGAVGRSPVHFLNRVENFFERASLPNPDRFYTDDSFASDHYEEMLRPEFRAQVPRDASLDFMRNVYALGRSGTPLHRIMRLDLMMAIAQNDLRKVHGATRQAGVSVRFPYIDPELIAHTGRLPERYKVRGLTKRYLFKRAMQGILPEEILKKKKQGFGLPIAVWLRSDRAFQSTVKETLFDARARDRGWWAPAFVEKLIAEHERGTWDHADYIWRLYILELWLRRWFDGA